MQNVGLHHQIAMH